MLPRLLIAVHLAVIALLISDKSTAQTVKEPAPFTRDWTKPYAPFRIAGNLYYVGTYDLACYLITTPEGHFLINTGVASSAPVIKANIESLGFKIKDLRVLLTNQAHYDHVGAMAAIQKMSGAKFMANSKDAQVMADGGQSDYYFGGGDPSFEPVKADRLLNDGDTVTLGATTITLLHHPGHTRGSSSYLVNVNDNKKSYRVLIANMPSIIIDKKFSETTTYPGMADDYAYTHEAMPKQEFDIWVAAHASQFDLHKKRKAGAKYNPGIFGDRKSYLEKLADLKAGYDRKKAEDN